MAVDVSPVLLQELVPPELSLGRAVRLEDHSLPEAGLVEGREWQTSRTIYPGSNEVTSHALGLGDEELELTGLLRDQWGGAGFALAARGTLRGMQATGYPVWLSWGETWGRFVRLRRLEFTHERQGLRYRLFLEALELEGASQRPDAIPDPTAPTQALDTCDGRVSELEAVGLPEGL